MNNKKELEDAGFKFSKTCMVEIPEEYTIEGDELKEGFSTTGKQKKTASQHSLNKIIDSHISDNILYFRKGRTIDRKVIRNIVHIWIEEATGITSEYKRCCFYLHNRDIFAKWIQNACEFYKVERDKENAVKDNVKFTDWKTQDELKFSDQYYDKCDYDKYTYNPCYLKKDRSDLEKGFEKFINENSVVDFWYKNGDNGEKNFGIPYKNTAGQDKTFYPDFICQLYDGTIVIFDTKTGQTAELAKEKAEALYKYCEENKMTGGIVRKDGTIWKVNYNETYDYNDNSQWKPFGDIYKAKKNYTINSERKSQ